MDMFNFSFELHNEDLRYLHSPASIPTLVEAPSDRVQSMHLSTTDHITQDESDSAMQTLDLLDDDTSSSETELEPEMGAQNTTAAGPAICQTPMKSPNKPRSYLGGVTPAAYMSQCFNEANSKKSSNDVSPSSVYSRPQTLQQHHQQSLQPLYSLPQTKYEIVAHNALPPPPPILRPSPPIHAPSPLSQSFCPSTTPTTMITPIPNTPLHATENITNSYRLTPAPGRWPPRKESLPSMLINTQSFVRYSNEHAPTPPLQQLAKRRCSPPPPPIDVKKSFAETPVVGGFETGDCLTFGVRKEAVRNGEGFKGERVVRLRVKGRDRSTREVGRSQVIIPAPSSSKVNDGSTAPSLHGRNFTTWDFDDKVFFEELRHEYARLTGPFHHFSARSLQTIRPSCCVENESDSFSEREMMRAFRRLGSGKGRYGWVQSIHQLSSQKSKSSSPTTPSRQSEDMTLEFIQGWSPTRIIIALLFIIVFSLLAAVLWILLGTRVASNGVRVALNDAGQPEPFWATSVDAVGYRNAGERVSGGMLVGILALMVGWTVVGGWIFVSWLVE